ncbi:MAG TPA: TetR/AcrR family transcriptional regulator [Desulfobacteria bacterium]|nr:TetR/AcrR family transcriptional regulator [Desulfobacteria bacterium]
MSDQKEEAIFLAALEVFSAKGFDRATMDEIALKAEVAKGTLFYRYKSKDELFLSLIRRAIDRFFADARNAMAGVDHAADKIAKAIQVQTELSFQYPEFAKLLLSDVWGKLNRQQQFRGCLELYLQFLRTIIEEGILRGELKPTDSTLLAASIFGMTAAATLHLLVSEKRVELAETIKELQQYCLNSILLHH